MFKLKFVSLLLFVCLAPYQLAAAKYDGSVPLLCVPIQAIDCDAADECLRGSADSVNIPQFMRINFKEKIISAVDESGKKASIRTLERIDGKIIMQGIQKGRGWTMIISEQTGKMSATVIDDQVVFVIFGACTPLND